MASPIITAVTPSKTQLVAGESIKITVEAFDADNRDVTVTVIVADSAGASATQTLTLHLNDGLTYTGSASAGVVFHADGDAPNVLTYTAP
jgi:hypothetical protein